MQVVEIIYLEGPRIMNSFVQKNFWRISIFTPGCPGYILQLYYIPIGPSSVQDLLACSRRMKIPFSSLIWQQHTRLWVNGLTCNSKEKRSLKHKWLDMNLESPLLILLLWKQIAFFYHHIVCCLCVCEYVYAFCAHYVCVIDI